jgi:mono/diheme cytochrome c family protein
LISRLYTRWALVCVASLVMLAALSLAPLKTVAQEKPATPVPSSNPLSGNPEAIEEGGKLYFKWCVQCHGPNADGRSVRFGEYAKDLRKFSLGYSMFLATVVAGRPEKKMPPWGEYLTPKDIQEIGAYLETLAIDGANWKD